MFLNFVKSFRFTFNRPTFFIPKLKLGLLSLGVFFRRHSRRQHRRAVDRNVSNRFHALTPVKDVIVGHLQTSKHRTAEDAYVAVLHASRYLTPCDVMLAYHCNPSRIRSLDKDVTPGSCDAVAASARWKILKEKTASC